jgi:hypothetical protein
LPCQPKAVGTNALTLAPAWALYQQYRAMPQIGMPDNCGFVRVSCNKVDLTIAVLRGRGISQN